MICPKCGSTIADGSSFCTECGVRLAQSQVPAIKDPFPASAPKIPHYVVIQVVLKEKLIGTGSGISSLGNLQKVINEQAAKGYRLHTFSTASSGSTGFMGGDRIQATMVFESIA